MINLSTKSLINTVLLLLVSSSLILFSLDPIAQDPAYHRFADQGAIWQINNGLNVLSNLPFLLAGLYGLSKLSNRVQYKPQLWLFYFAVGLVCFGSGYYHWQPDNHTLVYDRLPMTIAFMALFSLIIAEKISAKHNLWTLLIFVILGLASVEYWNYTESLGHGDLRPYALVQFFPLLSIVLLLSLSANNRGNNAAYWALILAYIAAKLLEHFDQAIYDELGFISGHSLKHLAVAAGIFAFSWLRR